MRRSKAAAAETRSTIISTASELFLDRGISAVSTRDIMRETGMTQGAFYRHFHSKDQLVTEANLYAALHLLETLRQQLSGKPSSDSMRFLINTYLHQADVSSAMPRCPLAILGSEIALNGDGVRAVAKCGYEQYVALVAEHLQDFSGDEARRRASAGMSLMVGAVTLARSVNDPGVASEILSNAESAVLLLFEERL